ncbi:MAG: hypothetical protein NTX22_01790 [Ignavibacteriales bacterium]|nr:hypothetical protein [Ignavibacteriales bacterium]
MLTIFITCLQQASWKKRLFESASLIFSPKNNETKQTSDKEKKIQNLEDKLKKRDEAISFLLRENIEIKKSIDGEI